MIVLLESRGGGSIICSITYPLGEQSETKNKINFQSIIDFVGKL